MAEKEAPAEPEPKVTIHFNPMVFTHEQNIEMLAKGWEPMLHVPQNY